MSNPDVHEFALGQKLRRLREDRNRTLAELAEQAGLPEEQLTAFEADSASPAVGDLLRIASSLGVSIGHFFQTEVPERRIEVVRSDERWTVRPRSESGDTLGYRYHALSHGLTEKLMAPFLVEVPPGQSAAVTQSSHDGEEFLFVLAGRVEVEVDGDLHQLGPGDAIYYDSRMPHSLRALEGAQARLLACVAQDRRAAPEHPIERAFR